MSRIDIGDLITLAASLSQLAVQWGVSVREIGERMELAGAEGREFGSEEDMAYFRDKRKAAIAALDAHLEEREAGGG